MAKNSPTTTVDPDHQQVQLIWVHATDLVPSDDNLRGTLTDISDLADSIDAVGILEPLSVTAIDGHAGPWRIVAGHRRHAAVQSLIEAGRWPKSRRLPCTIGAVAAGDEARVVAQLVENLQRVDLDPIDEANGYRRLVEHGWANTRIATATGRNKDRVAARLKLLNLPAGWQTQLRAGDITLDHAHRLASAPVEVITKLAARPAPAQYALEQAIADHKTVQARTLVQQVCKTRGLTLHNGSQWQLERDHDQVAKTTPTGLAKVLLPDAAALKVVIRPVYPGPSKFEVYVYAPQAATAATTATAHPVELTPVQEWQETCNQLHRDHRDALAAWEQSCKEFLVLDATDPDEVTVAWQERAACLGIDPDLFFPERGASTSEAKAVCAGCTVREQCLDYALDNGETHGIWGGKSERERRRLRLRRRADRRAAEMGDVSHLQLATSADPK